MRPVGGGSLDDFKARLPLVEVVARYVRLTKRGREHVGLCPFHKEKTPSFNVVGDKGFYHCFGCGVHGNAIDFVMAIESLPFAEALLRVADLTGIAPPERTAPSAPKPDPGLAEANAAAVRLFKGWLWGEAGAEARAYLRRRGLGRRAVERFGLGYAPNGDRTLRDALKREGFGEDLAVEAGLLARRDDGKIYDRFRHRLMFPIHDPRGRAVGFGGRALGEARAKYLNTPETPLFQKGRLLYGQNLAADAIRKQDRLVLVEGYMDVVALSEAGIEEAVAPLGTAVTEEQLALLWRHQDEPIVCLDGDKAGFAAALRLARRALPVMRGGQSLRFAVLPEGEDPDSLVRGRGGAAFEGLLGAAVPLSTLIVEAETGPVTTPEQFAALRRRLLDYANLAADPGLRRGLRDHVFAWLDARRLGPKRSFKSGGGATFGGAGGLERGLKRVGNDLIAGILQAPDCLDVFEEQLDEIEFESTELEDLKREILTWYASAPSLDAADLRDHFTTHRCAPLVERLLERPPTLGSDPQHVATLQQKLTELLRLHALRRERQPFEAISVAEDIFGEGWQAKRRALDRLLNGAE